MKALLFTNLYPSKREPTRGIFNLNLFGPLSELCETRVVSPLPWWTRLRQPYELFNVPHDNSSGIGASFPTYWSIPRMPFVHAQGMYNSLRCHVAQLRREFPFDIILAAFAYPDAVAAACIARDVGCPLVTNVLGSDVNVFGQRPILRRQMQWGFGRSQHIITVSKALKDVVIRLGTAPDKVSVRHNGVDGERFKVRDPGIARAQLGLRLDRRTICFVGGFVEAKAVEILVTAMYDLVHSGQSDVDLLLVGSGPGETLLRARVRDLGLENTVQFHGRRAPDEIAQFMSACDVFCLPSRREGCPNVILEALASGRPVVASRVGGIPEIVNGRNGILVPAEDSQALAVGLKQALQRSWDPAALRASVEYLSWNEVARGYHDILVNAVDSWKGTKEGW